MSKKSGIFSSLFFLCTMAILGVGCSSAQNCCPPAPCEQPCQPVCHQPVCPPPCKPMCPPPPCAPVCAPVCPPVCETKPVVPCDPFCKPAPKCHYPASNQLCCVNGITVTGKNPDMCMLGNQYPLEFEVKACDDVCDVVVTTHLPEGVSYVKSQPEAKVEGRKVTWNFGSMKKCEVRPGKIWVQCQCEGEQCACFCATATPVRFCSLLCAKPVLTCEKCGPAEVCPGDPVHYTITVSNRGSCAAQDVVVTDNVPEGLEHSSCLRTLTFRLGCLEPCQTKKVNVCFTAVKRGKVCNTATVTACNADTVNCQACTCVCCCGVDVVKVGTKEQQIGKNADYQITVTNTGDKPLHEVIVTDVAPGSTSIVAANGATINGNQAVWKLKELPVGEKTSFTVTLTTCTPGCFTNRVGVATCEGCTACADFTTRWKGRPSLNVCIAETDSPICIGQPTSYNITVTNQGSEQDSNVVTTVRFPKEVVPVAASGDSAGNVAGQVVTFAPIEVLNARQVVRYRVDGRAKESGDARVSVEVTSDSVKTPIVQQDSTIVN